MFVCFNDRTKMLRHLLVHERERDGRMNLLEVNGREWQREAVRHRKSKKKTSLTMRKELCMQEKFC